MTETIPAMRPATAAKLSAVLALRDSGVSQSTAARRLGVSRGNIHIFRRKHGIAWQEKYTREVAQ
tara:strand:+ start:449 stop:643 length:195 start_codon:yes stop_codon:yes gene_type:complete